MPRPGQDLAEALAVGDSVGGVTVGYGEAPFNLVAGPLPFGNDGDTENLFISVLQTGGPPPIPLFGTAPNGNIYQARVQVTVRSKVDNFEEGEALSRACRAKLHLVVLSGYVDVLAQESEPNYLGRDDRGLHRWSVNFLVRWKE